MWRHSGAFYVLRLVSYHIIAAVAYGNIGQMQVARRIMFTFEVLLMNLWHGLLPTPLNRPLLSAVYCFRGQDQHQSAQVNTFPLPTSSRNETFGWKVQESAGGRWDGGGELLIGRSMRQVCVLCN